MSDRQKLPDTTIVAFATVGYFALLVAGLGVASLVADEYVISTPGIGIFPAYAAAGAAIVSFALLLAGALRPEKPSFLAVVGIALASAAIHAIVLAGLTLLTTGSVGTVGTVLFEVLLGWVAPVFAGAAAVASWAAIALRRTEAGKPKWPWERRPDGS